MGHYCWCIFSYNFEFSVRIKFQSSDFRIFQVLQATPPRKHVGLTGTFRLMVHASFTIKVMIRAYHIYRDIWRAVIGEKLPSEKHSGNLGQNFCRFSFSHSLHAFKTCENLHHLNISHSTVYNPLYSHYRVCIIYSMYSIEPLQANS